MATMAELRQGLSDVVATISGLRCSPYMLPKPEAPSFCVIPNSIPYGATFNDAQTIQFDCWLYVSPADLERAQKALDEYLAPSGPKSIKAAIEANPSLGLTGVYAKPVGWLEYARLVDVAGSQLLGASLRVEVMA